MPENQSDIFARFTKGGKLDLSQLRRQFSESDANDLVNLSNWQVQYPPDSKVLEALCTVTPKNSKDAILGVLISTFNVDGSILYSDGGVIANPSTLGAPGVEFNVGTSTALWNSQDRGETVLCIVSGAIGNSNIFFFEKTFKVS